MILFILSFWFSSTLTWLWRAPLDKNDGWKLARVRTNVMDDACQLVQRRVNAISNQHRVIIK